MPITVQHQPAAALIGEAAYQGGLGQFNQQQYENGLRATQLALQAQQQRQQWALQQQHLEAQRQQNLMEMQQRDLMQRRQLQGQWGMNEADNAANWQRAMFDAANKAGNFADLRQHQAGLAEFRAGQDALKMDMQPRQKALMDAGMGLDPNVKQQHTKLMSDLSKIRSLRAMGSMDPQTYQAALADWDTKFGAIDWESAKVPPNAQAQQALQQQQVNDPVLGPSRAVKDKAGNWKMVPNQPVTVVGPDGTRMKAIPKGDDVEWMTEEAWQAQGQKAQPKAAAPKAVAPEKIIKMAKDIMAADAIADEPTKITFQQALNMAQKLAAGEGEGEPAADGGVPVEFVDDAGAPAAPKPGMGGAAPAPGAVPAPVAIDPKTPEGLALKEFGAAAKGGAFSPTSVKIWSEIEPMLSSGKKMTDPDVAAKLKELTESINAKFGKAAPPGRLMTEEEFLNLK